MYYGRTLVAARYYAAELLSVRPSVCLSVTFAAGLLLERLVGLARPFTVELTTRSTRSPVSHGVTWPTTTSRDHVVTWSRRAGAGRPRRPAGGALWSAASRRRPSAGRRSRRTSCSWSRTCGSGDCARCPCARECERASSTADAAAADSSGWTRTGTRAGRRTTWTPSAPYMHMPQSIASKRLFASLRLNWTRTANCQLSSVAATWTVYFMTYISFPQTDIIGAMTIVWRVRGKIIGSLLCSIVSNIVHSAMHTHMNGPNSCLLVRFNFSVVILYVRPTVYLYKIWLIGIILCYSLFVYMCFCCVGFSCFSTMPIDWLGRTSPKWPILCREGRKTLTQSINHNLHLRSCLYHCVWSGITVSYFSFHWPLCTYLHDCSRFSRWVVMLNWYLHAKRHRRLLQPPKTSKIYVVMTSTQWNKRHCYTA